MNPPWTGRIAKEDGMKGNSTTGRLLLLVVVLLAAGLVWGLAGALRSSSSPSPAPGQVVLKIGWTSEPDNLNPFIGWATTTYEIWALNYDFLFGWGIATSRHSTWPRSSPPKQNGGISPDGKIWTIHLRPDLKWSDGQPLTAADVAFTYNYVVKNHMANMALTTVGMAGAKAINPTTVQIICSHPKADMEKIFVPILPKHIWEHVSPAGGNDQLRQQAADRRQRPVLHGGFQEGRLRRDGAQPLLLGQEAGHRQDLLRDVPESRHDGERSGEGGDRRRLGHP